VSRGHHISALSRVLRLVRWCSELTTVSNNDLLLGLSGLRSDSSHSLDDLNTRGNLTEDGVLAIEVREGVKSDEELGAVGVLAGISHREETTTDVLVDEVLILEFGAIDRLSACAVHIGEVTTLSHEAWDHSVEGAILVMEGLARLADALLTGAEGSEVLRGLGGVGCKVKSDAASRGATDRDVEENGGIGRVVWLCHSFFFYLSLLLRRGVY
jgi:hypothetical protein